MTRARTVTGGFLGIHYNGMHDSSVCLLDAAGRLTYAVSEERLSRVKQDGRFPRRALAEVDLNKVAAIGVPYLDPRPGRVPTDPVFAALLHPAPGYSVWPHLSGGVFANVRANLALARLGFAKVFVTPPMGDDWSTDARDRLRLLTGWLRRLSTGGLLRSFGAGGSSGHALSGSARSSAPQPTQMSTIG